MTHQDQTTALEEITELLAEHGFDGLAQAVTVLLNEVMKLGRSHALGAGPSQRAEGRTGYANGFKLRTIHTRIGPLAVQVPQARGVEFYPSALEKGVRSERALKLAGKRSAEPSPRALWQLRGRTVPTVEEASPRRGQRWIGRNGCSVRLRDV